MKFYLLLLLIFDASLGPMFVKKFGSLASLARNHVYIFSSFQRVGINRHSIRPYIMVSRT